MQALLSPELATVAPPQRRRPRFRQWIAAALGLWLLTGVYLVNTQQQAVVTRFGAVVEPRVLPGIHIALPWPIDRVAKLKVCFLRPLSDDAALLAGAIHFGGRPLRFAPEVAWR